MPDTTPTSLPVVAGPACRHLLSKGMFITGSLNPAEDPHYPMGDGNCWCNQTQNVLGPDDRAVARASCIAGRTCYEAR
jgi:hypothetical protein